MIHIKEKENLPKSYALPLVRKETGVEQMSSNNRDYISCRNPAATKQQEAGWNRMVRNLEHRKAKENHRKEVKTNGRNA